MYIKNPINKNMGDMKMTNLEDVEKIYEVLKDKFQGVAIRHLPTKNAKFKMLNTLNENLNTLSKKKQEIIITQKIYEKQLRKIKVKEMTTHVLLKKVDLELEKINIAMIQAKSCLNVSEDEGLILGRRTLQKIAARL
jgi:hypothetical protein